MLVQDRARTRLKSLEQATQEMVAAGNQRRT